MRTCLSVSFYCISLEKAHNSNISHSSVVLRMHIGLCVYMCAYVCYVQCVLCVSMCIVQKITLGVGPYLPLCLRQSPLCLALHVFAKLAWLAARQESPVSSHLSLGEPGLQATTNPSFLWVLRI